MAAREQDVEPPGGWPRWLLAPLAAGCALRLAGLARQILGGDELHAVRAALATPLAELLVTYQRNDNCLPLSAFYRLLALAGVPLTEWVLRAPVLLAGLLLLVAGPLWVHRKLGRAPAVAFAWLLALSPFLIAYSRIARSYLPVVLLSAAAAAAFWEWLATLRPRYGAAYAGLAAMAVYFHPVAAPLVCMPGAFAVAEILARRSGIGNPAQRAATEDLARGARRRIGWDQLATVGGGGWRPGGGDGLVSRARTAASLRDLVAAKHRPSELPDLAAIGETVRLLAGTAILAVGGAVLGQRRWQGWCSCSACSRGWRCSPRR